MNENEEEERLVILDVAKPCNIFTHLIIEGTKLEAQGEISDWLNVITIMRWEIMAITS
uniref:Uncharacterized protein n=1 Tax=Tetranychus urticae TaxID=32264 RepID=T1KBW5_TETUR